MATAKAKTINLLLHEGDLSGVISWRIPAGIQENYILHQENLYQNF